MPYTHLDRTVFRLAGEDVAPWLSGLTTNEIGDSATFAALLTPQGKIIADFFIHKRADGYLIETPEKFGKALLMRLKMYRLRAKIGIEDVSDTYNVYALWNGEGDVGADDPRHSGLGKRLALQAGSLTPEHDETDYDLHRLALGVPDSAWAFETERVFPADANMDILHGLDLKKGCFIGQEVVSRMHRKSTIRKRMRGVKLSGAAGAGDALMAGETKAGEILHVNDNRAMALAREDRLGSANTVIINKNPAHLMDL